MSNERINFTTPVGRLVGGSVYKARDKDAEGRPLVTKTGPQAGQPRVEYFFAVAIAKGAEQHWAQTEWGKLIWQAGHAGFPQGQAQAPTFAWKITDGDSAVPNKAGRKPCEREGYRGNWVLSFSSGSAPKIYNKDGSAPIVEPDAVKLGYYVQVFGSVAANGSMQQPGVYLNHSLVALSGYGPEIVLGPDAAAVGFGGALPAGASAAPLGGLVPPALPGLPGLPPPPIGAAPAAPAALPALPALPGAAPSMSAPSPPTLPPMAAPAPVPVAPVTPNPAFLAPPTARRMLPAAQGATYEQLIANGWNDTLLVEHGMMAP